MFRVLRMFRVIAAGTSPYRVVPGHGIRRWAGGIGLWLTWLDNSNKRVRLAAAAFDCGAVAEHAVVLDGLYFLGPGRARREALVNGRSRLGSPAAGAASTAQVNGPAGKLAAVTSLS